MVCSELTKIIEHYNIFERGVLQPEKNTGRYETELIKTAVNARKAVGYKS